MANNFDISFDYSLDTKSYTSGGVTFTLDVQVLSYGSIPKTGCRF